MTTPAPAAFSPAKTPDTALIPLAAIQIREQVRKHFADEDLRELGASLKQRQLQPIVVRRNGAADHYELVAGERRVRAAKLAGLTTLRAEIHDDLADGELQVAQLVENVQRVDLSPFEQCEGVAALVQQLEGVDGKTGAQNAAAYLGKSAAWISKRAALVAAPLEVRQLVKGGDLKDLEVAAGLVELKQVAPTKRYEQMIDAVKIGETTFGEPITRDLVREEVKLAKQEAKRKEQEAKDRKAGTKKPLEPYQAQMARARAEKQARVDRWTVIAPTVKKFRDAAAKATGLDIEMPRYDGYEVDAPPSALETCNFQWTFQGSAEQAKKLVSKTGLTLKLEARLPALTPEQALKVEHALGAKLRWGKEWSRTPLTGKQLAAAAAKAGTKVELTPLPKPATAASTPAKPAAKTAKKKAR